MNSAATDPAVARPLLVVPTYNEIASLPALLAAALALPVPLHVLVVDDNSADGTARAVQEHAEFGRRLFLLARPGKLGLASAYMDGFQWALQHGYTAVIEMDADLSHDPQDVPRLLATLAEGADLAIGSRYVAGISVINWPLSRLVLSMGAGVYTRALTGLPLTDPTSGFKAIRREVLERLDWNRIKTEGYGFQIALHFHARRAGFRLREVPIVFTERRNGQSKLSHGIAVEAAGLVLKLALVRLADALTGRRRILGRAPALALARELPATPRR
ncbi:MAG TPA: polyprenol monophosphomannose synthase [Opitutaceae bacterium]|nr:polyprenol monophosphomannose synthase [Opitutaceae bacterium]